MSMNPAALDQLGTQPPAPEPVPDEDEIAALIEGMSDEEFAVLAAEYDVAPEPQLAGAGFSNYDPAQIELEMANTRILENERQMAVIQGQLDEQAFLNEKRRLMGTGVPPFIADLARPLLEGTGHVVEMANGQGVDAGQVMRRVLNEFGRAASMLDLSAELGSSMDEPDSSVTAEQRRGEFVRDYRAMVGI